MLVSHKHKFIFIKSRKTAGTSVEMLFQPFCTPDGMKVEEPQAEYVGPEGIVGARMDPYVEQAEKFVNHLPAQQISDAIGRETFDSYFKFTTIRNPFDQLVSGFFHEKANVKNADIDTVKRRFARYIWRTAKSRVATPFISANNQYCLDDFIRYETLHEDITRIADKLGLDIDPSSLPRTKTQFRPVDRPPYQTYYGPIGRRYAEYVFRDEILRFGYTFKKGYITDAGL